MTLVSGPMYLLSLLGNGALLAVVEIDSTLHKPMFLLLATLAATDLGLATSIAPGLLAVLWLGPQPVPYVACLVQMFFVHAPMAVESGVLLAMACDRAVAVGCPLHYPVLVTKARVGYAALALALKAVSCCAFPSAGCIIWALLSQDHRPRLLCTHGGGGAGRG